MAKSVIRQECSVSPEELFDFLIRNLGEHEFKVKKSHKATLIEAKAPATVWSWGAAVSLKIVDHPNGALVEITAKRPEIIDTGGINKTNLQKMQALVRLAQKEFLDG